ncbi:BadF/BadG/BcrA/BcrD ATPase family protein [Rhodobacter lacus]|uniref:BadF/BadG/BcrA/BcrD ATPase family protein n=1 Tax=Rhodobacter lacus TaxID=1641972 RepID=A0ABW5ADD2_9RHOB
MIYLGMDGGGSGCRAVLADAMGQVLARGEGGPANIASDFDTAAARLLALARELIAERPMSEVRAVLGVAGANLAGAGDRLAAALPFRAKVVQDVIPSVRGALGRADGIVAALGTGSVFARQIGGEVRVIGGWGFRLGDEASGAWMGRLLLNRIARMIDGYAPLSPLAKAVLEDLGGGPGLVAFTLTKTPGDHARLVYRMAAALEDPLSQEVLAETQRELRRAIGLLQTDPPLPVAWQGTLGDTLALADWPRRAPLGTALDGALAMAQDAATWTG